MKNFFLIILLTTSTTSLFANKVDSSLIHLFLENNYAVSSSIHQVHYRINRHYTTLFHEELSLVDSLSNWNNDSPYKNNFKKLLLTGRCYCNRNIGFIYYKNGNQENANHLLLFDFRRKRAPKIIDLPIPKNFDTLEEIRKYFLKE